MFVLAKIICDNAVSSGVAKGIAQLLRPILQMDETEHSPTVTEQ